MSYLIHLKCRQCGKTYNIEPIAACEECWAPLEAVYDYAKLGAEVHRSEIESRVPSMWRYRELLPLSDTPWVGKQTGFTPLFGPCRASPKRLARARFMLRTTPSIIPRSPSKTAWSA